ncbi:MAG: hypothetical protein HY744_05985 [Deltaproteobacteria bacterium]|nr:hypothetical protein [Deltaproteobacteria bacterium]
MTTLGPGSRVQVMWQDGRIYGATVLRFDGQGYAIRWDDGLGEEIRQAHHLKTMR